MKLLIIDTETTGLNAQTDRTIEVAAILYSVPHRTTLFQLSTLLNAPNNDAEHINRIPHAVLPEVCQKTQQSFIDILQNISHDADYAIAHNAAFDKQWFDGSHLPILTTISNEPLKWLCTLEDFSFPKQSRQGENLVSLALNHGIGVSSAHRALTDCSLIAALFDRMEDLEDMIENAKMPKALFRADVSFDDKDLAKNAGFKWNTDLGKQQWTRRMSKADREKLRFPVIRMSEFS